MEGALFFILNTIVIIHHIEVWCKCDTSRVKTDQGSLDFLSVDCAPVFASTSWLQSYVERQDDMFLLMANENMIQCYKRSCFTWPDLYTISFLCVECRFPVVPIQH